MVAISSLGFLQSLLAGVGLNPNPVIGSPISHIHLYNTLDATNCLKLLYRSAIIRWTDFYKDLKEEKKGGHIKEENYRAGPCAYTV